MSTTAESNFRARNSSAKAKAKLKRLAKQFETDERSITAIFGMFRDFDQRESWPNDDGASLPKVEIDHLIEQQWIPEKSTMTNREVVDWFFTERKKVTREAVTDAFIAGLLNKRYDYHSPLGSFAATFLINKNGPDKFSQLEGMEYWVPSEKENELNFLRLAHHRLNCQYGGHEELDYAAYDFWKFNQGPTPVPSDADKAAFGAVLNAIRNLPANATLSPLEKSLSGIVRGNNRDRQHLLEILGYCGILGTPDGIPMRKRYVSRFKRPMPNHFYSKEWHFPTSFWKGAVGIDESEVAFWFPGFER